MRKEPLPGVTMTAGEDGIQLLTDQNGEAETSMLEGRYPISFSYSGEDAILSVENAEMIISGGSTTLIELTAHRPEGRVRLRANREDMGNASFLLREPDTGEEYGPYSFAGAGTSDLLAPGEYEVSLHSVYNVSKALDREKYDVIRIGITKDGVYRITIDIFNEKVQAELIK